MCSQSFFHILCGNILIVHTYSKCYEYILQIFFSCTLPHSLSAHLLIHTFWSDTRNSRGSALSYTGPIIWNSLPFSVCHAWTVECQTTVKSPPLFHLFPAMFRSQFIRVCVDKCDVGEFLNDLGLWVYIRGCHCRKLLVLYVVCGFVVVNDLVLA